MRSTDRGSPRADGTDGRTPRSADSLRPRTKSKDRVAAATVPPAQEPSRSKRDGSARAHLSKDVQPRDHHHRQIGSGGARAAVFGISDGLVTNVALILGIAGAHPGASFIRLAGVAGLVAGAFSMAAGEYVSMRAQAELFERELALENFEIQRRPEGERRELVRIYESRGIDPEVAHQLASEMMRTPELALETHAREELGINPRSLGSPVLAALSSFVAFAIGAALPLVPWLFSGGTAATLASVAIGAVAAFGIGVALSVFTRRSWWRTALRQLLIMGIAAAATYGVGHALGATVSH